MRRLTARDGAAEPLWPHWLFGLAVGSVLTLGAVDAVALRRGLDAEDWRQRALTAEARLDGAIREQLRLPDPSDGIERIPAPAVPLPER